MSAGVTPPTYPLVDTPVPLDGDDSGGDDTARQRRGKEQDGPEDEDDLDFDVIFAGRGAEGGYGCWEEEEVAEEEEVGW